MFGIGTGELLLLMLIALLVLGPERMPKLARDLGKMVSDLRRTSEELRNEFLNADRTLRADRMLDVAARAADATAAPPQGKAAEVGTTMGRAAPAPTAAAASEGTPEKTEERVPPDVGATQADAATGPSVRHDAEVPPIPAEPEETAFDREARLARERLEDPELATERAERAAREGWKVPTDDAGTSDRQG